MKKRSRNCLVIVLAIIAILFLLLYAWFKGIFFTFEGIKAEYYEEPVQSPNGSYTARAYYEYYGGAAGGVNTIVEITDHTKADSIKVIYYADAQSEVNLKWEDEQTLYVMNKSSDFPAGDRSIKLNVDSDIYHDTGRACNSILLKDTYTNCYYKK
ncbi:hypothetical protein D3C73_759820 [compost metagenome]